MNLPVIGFASAVAGLAFGCVDDPSELRFGASSVDKYEEDFQWEQPRYCDVYLGTRKLSEEARVAEYTARVDDVAYSLVYELIEGDEYPLSVYAVDGTGADFVQVEANASGLRVTDANGIAYEVDGYDEPSVERTNVQFNAQIESTGALHLIGCGLPLREELGPIPAFMRNKAVGGRIDGTDVSVDQENAPEILDWDGNVTILGAFLLQSACANRDGWDCPCIQWHDRIAGRVDGWCGSPGPRTVPSITSLSR